jgi:SET domain-containing protein
MLYRFLGSASEKSGVISNHGIAVKRSPIHGLGVFATRQFNRGTVIEVCPVLVISKGDVLGRYVYSWGRTKSAVALGYGSLYNHSSHPNAQATRDDDNIYIEALSRIMPGEEITISYGKVVMFTV